MRDLRIYPDPSNLTQAVADFFVENASKAIVERGIFNVLLSGGSTPRGVYLRLAESHLTSKIAWGKIHLFWGDERCVSPDDVNSNYRMVRENLLEHVTIPAGNVHRIKSELEPERAATQYEEEMRNFFFPKRQEEAEIPAFDLILLGMGLDGHTASLFPGDEAISEVSKWVLAVEHTKPPPPLVPRVTVTPVLINTGREVIFLVTGEEKAARLERVLSDPYTPDRLPAQIIKPKNGRLTWFLDEAAASRLPWKD
jgi:6-phosphogluconolactonase